MTPEEKQFWDKVLPKEIAKHSQPSEKTLTMFQDMSDELTSIKVNMGKFEEKLDNHIANQKDSDARVEKNFEELKKSIDDFIRSAKKTFASKLTEKIVYALVAIILVFFIKSVITTSLEIKEAKNQITIEQIQHLIEENNNKFFEKK